MRYFWRGLMVLLLAISPVLVSGCPSSGPVESGGEQVEQEEEEEEEAEGESEAEEEEGDDEGEWDR